MASGSQVIAVTGATGFIAGHIIKQLLADTSHHIRGSVRSLSNQDKSKFLTDLPNADERLKLFEANLSQDGSFDDMMDGVDCCMHCASPFFIDSKDPQKELVDPAVNGVKTVFDSCKKAGVKHVILTSSLAAATEHPIAGRPVNDKDWNTQSNVSRNPYYYSKTMAEKAAWAYAEEHKAFKLTVLNPVVVWGPSLGSGVNSSVEVVRRIATKEFPGKVDLSFAVVDVRDCAKGHINAINNEATYGQRIFLSSTHISMGEVADTIKRHFPAYDVPSMALPNIVVKGFSFLQPSGTGAYIRSNIGKGEFKVDNTPSKQKLNLDYMNVPKTIVDTVLDLQKWKHLPDVEHKKV